MKSLLIARRGLLAGSLLSLLVALPVAANRLSSPNYTIDTSIAAPFGGQTTSTNYKMVVGGGEAINGSPASSSYKLGQGYVAQLEQSLELTLSQSSVALGTITSGASKQASFSAAVITDAPGYNLAINQNANLTSGANTIPALASGTIASPISWTEGTTKGLGITITGGPSIPAKWGTAGGYKYAAIPSAATTLYTRSGYSGGVTDTITMQPRVDVTPSQPTGAYSNIVTITATMVP